MPALGVMRNTPMIWFEDVSAINEPVLSFPVLGRISMKQFFILGVSGMASYALFSSAHGPVSAVPMCIGALFALVKPPVGSAEWMIFSAVRFLLVVVPRQALACASAARLGKAGEPRHGTKGKPVPDKYGEPGGPAAGDARTPLRLHLKIGGTGGREAGEAEVVISLRGKVAVVSEGGASQGSACEGGQSSSLP